MYTPEELHVIARQLAAGQYLGHKFDKKMLRWNDIVAVGMGYQAAGGYATATHGVNEAIQCCIVGHDMYSPGRGPLTLLEQFNQWATNTAAQGLDVSPKPCHSSHNRK